MSRKTLLVLGLLSLVACAEPATGPSTSYTAVGSRPDPGRQSCGWPGTTEEPVLPGGGGALRQCRQVP